MTADDVCVVTQVSVTGVASALKVWKMNIYRRRCNNRHQGGGCPVACHVIVVKESASIRG